MSEPVTKSVPQEQQEQRIETRTAMKRIGGFTIVPTAVAVLDVLGAAALFAQGQVQVQVQVLADIAWRNCVLRLQGVRGLG
jgi:hypothetical protein